MIDPAFDIQFKNISTSSADWKVPSSLAYFQGHFPDMPILPAIAIMDVSLQFLRTLQNNPLLQIEHIHSSKFTIPIVPEMTVQIKIIESAKNHWQVEWLSHGDNRSLAKIDLLLRDSDLLQN